MLQKVFGFGPIATLHGMGCFSNGIDGSCLMLSDMNQDMFGNSEDMDAYSTFNIPRMGMFTNHDGDVMNITAYKFDVTNTMVDGRFSSKK